MYSRSRPATTSMKKLSSYEVVPKDNEGNELRVGDFVEVLSTELYFLDMYYKIKELSTYQATLTSLGPEKLTYHIVFGRLVKVEHSPELTAYILKNCGD